MEDGIQLTMFHKGLPSGRAYGLTALSKLHSKGWKYSAYLLLSLLPSSSTRLSLYSSGNSIVEKR